VPQMNGEVGWGHHSPPAIKTRSKNPRAVSNL
jgi:hypothetical protein